MRAAAAADEEFSAEFLTMARAVFDMIDKDQSGTLTKKEIVDAVRGPRPSRSCLRLAGSPGSAVTHWSTKHRLPTTRRLLRSSMTAATRTSSTCSCRRASKQP